MCTRTEHYLNHPNHSHTLLQQDRDGERLNVLIYQRGNIKWLTDRPTYYPSQRGVRILSCSFDYFSLWRQLHEMKRDGNRQRGRGKSSETRPKAHLSVDWGGLGRAEMKSLWEHCDHNLHNPQPLQLSLTGPETLSTHTRTSAHVAIQRGPKVCDQTEDKVVGTNLSCSIKQSANLFSMTLVQLSHIVILININCQIYQKNVKQKPFHWWSQTFGSHYTRMQTTTKHSLPNVCVYASVRRVRHVHTSVYTLHIIGGIDTITHLCKYSNSQLVCYGK